VESDEDRYFLRFAACFGGFLMSHDATISYRNLPMRLYELTRYSFRREQAGELAGLRRLRAFTMPDVHAFCKDLKQAKKEFKRRFKLCRDTLKGIGLEEEDYELGLRVTEEFYKKNKAFIYSIVRTFGRPALVEMWRERFFYFILKYEFNFVDALDKASALSTDQIDVENGERYGIVYMDDNGRLKHPLILHCSPSGAIERVIYALLESAYMDVKKNAAPRLPLWLSPTQVRLIPVSDSFEGEALKILKKIERRRIRIDLDDRGETVQKKIRDAEREWVPYIIVYGEKEVTTEKLPVRVRGEEKIRYMSLKELISEIKNNIKGKPFKPLPLPLRLQQRPRFVG
jgi:threonyl-tRNA synthetase